MIKECYGAGNTIILEYCCDFCNYSTTRNKTSTGVAPIMECDACGRHVCCGHRMKYKSPLFSDSRIYCLECWEIGKKYRDSMIDVQSQAWESEKNIRLEWHDKGRENKRRKQIDAAKEKRVGVIASN